MRHARFGCFELGLFLWVGCLLVAAAPGGSLTKAQESTSDDEAAYQKAAGEAFQQGKQLYDAKRFAEAAKHFQAAAIAYEGVKHPRQTALSHGWSADCFRLAGDDAAAAKHYQRAVGGFKSLKDNQGLSLNASQLGKCLHRLERYQEAIPHFQAAAAAYEAIDDKIQAAWMLNWLGACHAKSHDDEASAKVLAEAVQRFTELKIDHGVAETAGGVGMALYRLQRFQEAIGQFETAAKAYNAAGNARLGAHIHMWIGDSHKELKDDKSALISLTEAIHQFQQLKDHAGTALSAHKAGQAEFRLKNFKNAVAHFSVAARAYSEVGDWKNVAAMYGWTGDCHRENGDSQRALTAYSEALRRYQQLNDEQGLATNATWLGSVYRELQQYKEATRFYKLAADTYSRLGEMKDVADQYTWLSQCYEDAGEFDAARDAYVKLIELRTKLFGAEHWKVTDARWELDNVSVLKKLTAVQRRELREARRLREQAESLDEHVEFEKALQLAQKSLEICRRILGPQHRDVARSTFRLGRLHTDRQEFAKAAPLFAKTLEIQRATLGDAHPDVTSSMLNLARAYCHTTQHDKAETLARQAVEIATKSYGEQDPQVAEFLAASVDIYVAMMQPDRAERLARQSLAIRIKAYGEAHPDTIESLVKVASVYMSTGQYVTAEKHYRRIVELTIAALGEDHPDTALAHNNHGYLCGLLARFDDAEKAHRKALEIELRHFGPDHPLAAASYVNLARSYGLKGEGAKVEEYLSKALQIRRKAYGPNHPATIDSLASMAAFYEAGGKLAEAEEIHRQCLDLRKQVLGNDHPDAALSMTALASLYYTKGDYRRSEQLYRDALALRKRVQGADHPDTVAVMQSFGRVYLALGDFEKAESLFVRALESTRKTFGNDHPNVAASLSTLGELYANTGDLTRAEPLLKQALEIRRRLYGEMNEMVAGSYSKLASLYHVMGDRLKSESYAIRYHQILRQLIGDDHPDIANALLWMADRHARNGDSDKAEKSYLRCIEIYKKSRGQNTRTCAAAMRSLGTLYLKAGQLDRAKPLLEQAVEILTSVVGREHADTAEALAPLAGLHGRLGDHEKELELYQAVVDIYTKTLGKEHFYTANATNNLALTYYHRRDFVRAEALMKQSIQAAFDFLNMTAGIQSERQQIAATGYQREMLDAYLRVATESGKFDDTAYQYVLAWKGIVFARQQAVRAARKHPELASVFDDLQNVTSQLSALSRVTPQANARDDWRTQIEQLTERKEKLEAELTQQSRLLDGEQTSLSTTPEELRAKLPPNSVLVDFLEFSHGWRSADAKLEQEMRLAAFVLSKEQGPIRIDLGPVDAIAEQVEEWRKTFGSGETGQTAAETLRQFVWQPLEEFVAAADLVLLSTDGITTQFPFGALPGSKRGTFLLEDKSLVLIAAPQLLPRLLAAEQPNANEQPSLLVIGGVDFADVETTSAESSSLVARRSAARVGEVKFGRLPGTRVEANQIQKMFSAAFKKGRVSPLFDVAASEQAFRTHAPKARYLHLATHGHFAPPQLQSATESSADEPSPHLIQDDAQMQKYHAGLLSGLALAGANLPPRIDEDDGILTALELSGCDLARVELAVLSACETGLGKVAGGEGVLGLQRAFQLAGARTTVTSLWKVHDTATQLLMSRFYENLWQKKMSKLAALREAQLWMLRDADQLRSDGTRGLTKLEETQPATERGCLPPYYWAAFVLSGDWR